MNILFEIPYLVGIVVTVCVYWGWLENPSYRRWWLCGMSCVAIAAIHPGFLALIFLVSCAITLYWSDLKENPRRLGVTLLAMVSLLLAGKFGPVFYERLFPESVTGSFLRPLGFSYFVFRIIQYVMDCHRGLIQNTSFSKVFTFLVFFPTFPAGPLETFQNFYGRWREAFDATFFKSGIRRILLGYFKKAFVVDLCFVEAFGPFLNRVSTGNINEVGAFEVWMFGGLSFLRAFLDLSAYSDIAIGISRLFGIEIVENFRFPLLSTNIADFWRRYHISLSQWCRNQVFLPVLGWSRRLWLATFASMLVLGAWHDLKLNWILWGAYHGSALVGYAYWRRYCSVFFPQHGWTQKTVLVFSSVITFLFVSLGYLFAGVPNFQRSGQLFSILVGLR